MPSKKKKYNARFPPARIKKIMQTDDEIGKVAAAVPVLISKCLEMFLSSILSHAGEVTKAKRAKTMSTSHLKECIMNESMFDFLKDVVASVPDRQNEEEPSTSALSSMEEQRRSTRKRNAKTSKKRFKLGKRPHRDNEEEEEEENPESEESDLESRDSSNGLCPSFSSPAYSNSQLHHQQSLPSTSSNVPPENKASFHIPLDDLISVEKVPLLKSEDDTLHIATTDSADEEKPAHENHLQTMHSLTSFEGDSFVTNGEPEEQHPMDLSKDSQPPSQRNEVHGNHLSTTGKLVKQTTVKCGPPGTAKPTSQGSNQPVINPVAHVPMVGTPPIIPSPLNMTHLYSPVSLLTPPIVGVPGTTRDLSSSIPQGGMLSFLYSAYPGDVPVPGFAPDLHPKSRKIAGTEPRTSDAPCSPGKQHSSNSNILYPYNPVAEHYKRLATSSISHPYLPKVVPNTPLVLTPNTVPNQVSVPSRLDDDEDYDA